MMALVVNGWRRKKLEVLGQAVGVGPGCGAKLAAQHFLCSGDEFLGRDRELALGHRLLHVQIAKDRLLGRVDGAVGVALRVPVHLLAARVLPAGADPIYDVHKS